MPLRKTAAALAVLFLVQPAFTEEAKKLKKPSLDLRASPRDAFAPAEVLFTAELRGGDDMESLYCPETEWEWGDGGKSVQEADCDPWTETTKIERRFTAHHSYTREGSYTVRVTLKRMGKVLMRQSVQVNVRSGVGEMGSDGPY